MHQHSLDYSLLILLCFSPDLFHSFHVWASPFLCLVESSSPGIQLVADISVSFSIRTKYPIKQQQRGYRAAYYVRMRWAVHFIGSFPRYAVLFPEFPIFSCVCEGKSRYAYSWLKITFIVTISFLSFLLARTFSRHPWNVLNALI